MSDRLWAVSPELPIGLGCNTFGRITDETDSRRVLDAFVEAGGTLIDTADTYGASETIIGSWMHERGNRDRHDHLDEGR